MLEARNRSFCRLPSQRDRECFRPFGPVDRHFGLLHGEVPPLISTSVKHLPQLAPPKWLGFSFS